MTDKIQVNLRLHKEVVLELKKKAKKQKRSLNNLLEVIIDEYLQKHSSNEGGFSGD
ncbi:MAG: Arc family DNA-binding protein [Ruminococcus sp.]|nr:Arc family DNA-binding protein [Ruminococcus sp.]